MTHDPAATDEPMSDRDRRLLVRAAAVHLDEHELPHRIDLLVHRDQVPVLCDALATADTRRHQTAGRALRVTHSKLDQARQADRMRQALVDIAPPPMLPLDLDVTDAAHLGRFAADPTPGHAAADALSALYRALADAFASYWTYAPDGDALHTYLSRTADTGTDGATGDV